MTSRKKDLYNLADGWLELESDPGLFSLLLEDMGVEGTQVYSLMINMYFIQIQMLALTFTLLAWIYAFI